MTRIAWNTSRKSLAKIVIGVRALHHLAIRSSRLSIQSVAPESKTSISSAVIHYLSINTNSRPLPLRLKIVWWICKLFWEGRKGVFE